MAALNDVVIPVILDDVALSLVDGSVMVALPVIVNQVVVLSLSVE